ncbi:MAG TPA: glutathione S-transferase family protein [Candidatus Acidoferrales bacterium]|nr:glutathione S-transferase family protein [Candidatus Acidoferrales bacterium]
MVKIYGTSQSRAARSLWAAEEVGLKYEHVPVAPNTGTRKPEYLKINPNGHVPALDDNGLILFESMAINLYLAEKYGKSPLWPSTVEGRGQAYQWSVWAMTETEPHLLTVLMHRMFLPQAQRSEAAASSAIESLKAPLKVLDDALKNRAYLLGSDFTIADLNVASVLSLAAIIKLDMTATPAVGKWLQTCLGRPAMQKARSMK